MSRTSDIVNSIIMVSVAIVIMAMVMLPMIDSAVNQTVDGEQETLTNTATAYFAPYDGNDDVTISYVAEGTVVTNSSSYTDFVLDNKYININDTVITVWDDTGKNVIAADWSITIAKADLILVDSTSEDATYGLWTSVEGLYVKNDAKLYVYNDTTYASEGYNGTGIAITTATTEYKGVYEVSAVAGDNPGLFAPIEVTYYTQVSAIDDNLKAIMEVVPILVVIGILLASVYMFVTNTRRA